MTSSTPTHRRAAGRSRPGWTVRPTPSRRAVCRCRPEPSATSTRARGEPILFVHGTPTWSFEYRHLIRALSASHRCIAPDHLGFGLSQRPADFDYRPESHAQVLAQFVDRLGLDRFTLVVHDYGGPIGLPLALDRPDRVRRLVVLNSWMWSIAGDPRMARGARMLGGRLGRLLYRRANLSLRSLMPYAYGDRKQADPRHPPPVPGAVPRRRQPGPRAVAAGPGPAGLERSLRFPLAAPPATGDIPAADPVGPARPRPRPRPARALAHGAAPRAGGRTARRRPLAPRGAAGRGHRALAGISRLARRLPAVALCDR